MTDHPSIHEQPFILPIRVYYEDTDFSGIVYHANHLKFFERGRTEALRSCGISHSDLLTRDTPLVFAIRRMDTHWKLPAKIDDQLEVRTWFVQAKGARMDMRQELWRTAPLLTPPVQDLIASASVEAACLSPEGRPRRLPEDVIVRFHQGKIE